MFSRLFGHKEKVVWVESEWESWIGHLWRDFWRWKRKQLCVINFITFNTNFITLYNLSIGYTIIRKTYSIISGTFFTKMKELSNRLLICVLMLFTVCFILFISERNYKNVLTLNDEPSENLKWMVSFKSLYCKKSNIK